MGAGLGVVFVVAGAILYWAVEIDLPNVDESALGAILMICGIIAAVASTVLRTQTMQNGIGSGIGLFAAGAGLVWAVDLDLPYVFEGALGVILIVGGLVSLVATAIMHVHSTRPSGFTRQPRQTPPTRPLEPTYRDPSYQDPTYRERRY